MNRWIAIFILPLLLGCGKGVRLPDFIESPYFGEQVLVFDYSPDVKIEINAPNVDDFNSNNPTALVFYALPNGNTTDWTIGKKERESEDWHYQIQHIGAQTRYVRSVDGGVNYVTIYLETASRSWGTWRRSIEGSNGIINDIVDYCMDIFSDYNPYVVLSGHSGGGNFIFGFMESQESIPAYVKRISFLDSNYNWDNEKYGPKLLKWLDLSPDNCLSVIAYNDSVALYNGSTFVSPTGGTWYRSRVMQRFLEENMNVEWSKEHDQESGILRYSADKGRVEFLLKENPDQEIYHTILVEKNGFIHTLFSGTSDSQNLYDFWSDPVFGSMIQSDTIYPHHFRIPQRGKGSVGSVEFMEQIAGIDLDEREERIYQEIVNGNLPSFLRNRVEIRERLTDAEGVDHDVLFYVMPDFLSIGSEVDYCRVPMIPGTAQRIADALGAILPTPKISDIIFAHAHYRMDPHPMTPDSTMVTIPVFIAHNDVIERQRVEKGFIENSLIVGHKKDIVLTNHFSKRPNAVIIYGWHYPDGKAIQPAYAGHHSRYVDYSHGVRLVSDEVLIDGVNMKTADVLRDSVLYALLSDEPLLRIRY